MVISLFRILVKLDGCDVRVRWEIELFHLIFFPRFIGGFAPLLNRWDCVIVGELTDAFRVPPFVEGTHIVGCLGLGFTF
jgi:hypothetical protein